MGCTTCNQNTNPCCPQTPCSDCKVKLNSNCITYNGDNLTCTGASTNTNLNTVIQDIDAKICSSLQDIAGLSTIVNIGDGAEIYEGEDNLGNRQLRSITSEDESIVITQGADTIDLSAVNANFTEESSSAPGYILNRNPTKQITANYQITAADNNYVIEVANGASNITITIPASGLPTDNYFVGFIQNGTGTVTFSGATIVPVDLSPVIYGQGHPASIEIIGGTRYLLGTLKDA